MFVSLVLSAFNDERWLPQSIESVLAQTHTNFELILVDDGSTDGTLAVMHKYAQRDPRIRVITHENWGLAQSRTDGIAQAAAEWVALVDADDLMLPHWLARQIEFVRDKPRLAVAACLGYLIDEQGDVIGQTTSDLVTAQDCERYVNKRLWFRIANPGVFIRKSVFQAVGGYRRQLRYLEDADLWFRITEQGWLILVQQERLIKIRKRWGSMTARSRQRFQEPVEYGHWIYACMEARRANRPEPTYAQFRAMRDAEPLRKRLQRAHVATAETWYRLAVVHYTTGRPFQAVRYAGGAVLLRPAYYTRMLMRKAHMRGMFGRALGRPER